MIDAYIAYEGWKNNYALSFFSERSMVVYLYHQQIIYCSIYIFNGVLNPGLNACVNFMFAMGLSMLIASIMIKNRFTRFLVGEK